MVCTRAVPTRPRTTFKSWPPFLRKALRFVREDVRDYFYPLVDFYKRVAHVCAWLPILWHDRDWDAAALVQIVQFKLRRMAATVDASDVHPGNPQKARDMRQVAEHLDRYLDSHKYGPPRPGGLRSLDDELVSVPGSRHRQFRPLTPAEVRWVRQHEAIKLENWNAAWELIRKHGRGWWD